MEIEEVWDKSIGVLPRHGNPAPEIPGLRPYNCDNSRKLHNPDEKNLEF